MTREEKDQITDFAWAMMEQHECGTWAYVKAAELFDKYAEAMKGDRPMKITVTYVERPTP